MSIDLITQPFGGRSLGDSLIAELRSDRWNSFRAAVAFAKLSGVRYLAEPLHSFAGRGNACRVAVGLDHDGTSLEGLQDLWRVLYRRGQVFIFKEGQGGQSRTFHPKLYLFGADAEALALIGSGNLTQGGLFTNHEATLELHLDLDDAEARGMHAALQGALDGWQTPGPACREVDASLIKALYDDGDLLSEVAIAAAKRAAMRVTRTGQAAATAQRPPLFGHSGASTVPPAPTAMPAVVGPVVRPPVTPPAPRTRRRTATQTLPRPSAHQTFLIEVRPHHNGEVFLSKTAINEDPGFFGYPFTGWTTPKRAGNAPYPMAVPDPQVEIVVYNNAGNPALKVLHSLNVVFYSSKSEIRITIPPQAIARIPQMSLLSMTRNPARGLDYRLEFYPPTSGTAAAQALRGKLTHELPSGGAGVGRHYGWA